MKEGMKIVLKWNIYVRCSNKWYTLCKECQKKFTEIWGKELDEIVHLLSYNDSSVVRWDLTKNICKECLNMIKIILGTGTLILGNKAYEPAIEISRKEV